MATTPLRDRDIREALQAELLEEYCDGRSLVVSELGLCANKARVDLAVVNGSLLGYEIKSDRDNFSRLPRQAVVYNAVFDRVTIVVGESKLAQARSQVPSWWGIKVARQGESGVVVEDVRPALRNASRDPYAVAQLFWRDEALLELERRGLATGVRSKSRRVLWRRLAESVDLDELACSARETLKSRIDWRSEG